ncbi:ABC transporter substrate-binding protein, partial [Caldivirga sp.]|uniref:ABC transporter substrate-binding protein n=1 Tax=Caldivirga sp. TaxID=2080243 RepID=UPI0025BF21D4
MVNVKTYLPVILIAVAIVMLMHTTTVNAQQVTLRIGAGYTVYVPWPAPWWNPWAPGNLVWSTIDQPLALIDWSTLRLYPILAKNWTVQLFPNGSALVTIYLRKGLYWFNGSAVMPFTAWDVYAEFYIGVKAFGWYVPWINQSLVDEDIRVLNNYTIQILFQKWAFSNEIYVLATTMYTPYFVWKPVIEELKTMNVTQAMNFGSNNITKMIVPYWEIGPYYVTSVGASGVVIQLEPPNVLKQWYEVFPINSFSYYPTVEYTYTTSYSQQFTMLLGHQIDWIWAALSTAQMDTLNATGKIDVGTPYWDFCQTKGLWLNPLVYPFNIPQVRQAFRYIFNSTAIALVFPTSYFPTKHDLWISDSFLRIAAPESIRNIAIDYPIGGNWTEAAQLLESAGLYKKGNQWYLPNGTPLKLTIYVSSFLTDMQEEASIAAEELEAFGIPTTVLSMDPATLNSRIIPSGDFEALWGFWVCPAGYLGAFSAMDSLIYVMPFTFFGANSTINKMAWPFAWPNVVNGHLVNWYCKPYNAPSSMILPNYTIVW